MCHRPVGSCPLLSADCDANIGPDLTVDSYRGFSLACLAHSCFHGLSLGVYDTFAAGSCSIHSHTLSHKVMVGYAAALLGSAFHAPLDRLSVCRQEAKHNLPLAQTVVAVLSGEGRTLWNRSLASYMARGVAVTVRLVSFDYAHSALVNVESDV